MDTSLIDSAISSAVAAATALPQIIPAAPVANWPGGSEATVATNTYRTTKGSGFQVIGQVKFPNGYIARRTVDVGPNSTTGSKEWPADIEAGAQAHSAYRAKQALDHIARAYSPAEQTALLFKWGSVTGSGEQEWHPKLGEVAAWIAAVTAAALTGEQFPKAPVHSFVELMAE